MKRITIVFLSGIAMLLSFTTINAAPIKITTSSHTVWGEWYYEIYDSDFNLETTLSESFDYHNNQETFNAILYEPEGFEFQLSSRNSLRLLHFDHYSTAPSRFYEMPDGYILGRSRIDTYIESIWTFRPSEPFLKAEMQYLMNSNYYSEVSEPDKPFLEISLIDLTTSEYLIEPFRVPYSEDLINPVFNFNVNPEHDYAFKVYGSSKVWDQDETHLKMFANFQTVSICEADIDEDKDVDGSDLASQIGNLALIDVIKFAQEFGRTDCL